MKNLIAIAFCLMFQSSLEAQITVSSSDFISGPDTVLISTVTDYTNINFQNTGANYTWDFSFVVIDSQKVDTFLSMSSASFIYQLAYNNFLSPSYQASYFKKADANAIPTGGLPLDIQNPVIFEKVSNSKFERVGLGAELNGVAIPITADTIDVVYEFPMTYQDAWTSNSYLFFDLNPTFDAQFKRHQNRNSVVDGYGSLTTPFGTFDCIRIKAELNYTDSLFFDFLGAGGQWIPLPTQPEIQYQWIAKNQKTPVFTINVTNSLAGPVISKVEFRDSYGVATIHETKNNVGINIYPNPASEIINLTDIDDITQIAVRTLDGKIIYHQTNLNTNTISLDCSNWPKGIFIVDMVSSQKTISKKIILH
jgi:hypothetical protein